MSQHDLIYKPNNAVIEKDDFDSLVLTWEIVPLSDWSEARKVKCDRAGSQFISYLFREGGMAALQRARFLFDLNGFHVVRGALSLEEVAAANRAIDTRDFQERKGALRTAADGTAFTGDRTTGRFDLAGMLGWEEPHRNVFRSILNHPSLVPYIHLFVGEGYRLDHSPMIIAQERGSVGSY